MSVPAGKRPLSDIAREAEANGRVAKRRPPPPPQRRPPPPPSFPPSLSSFRLGETVYRILCPASKTGSVIGKGGSIIKAIRQDTGAMIRVEEAVFPCDERVVTIAAWEESFRPQKFRGPGNYRKPRNEDGDGDVFDTEVEAESGNTEGIPGQGSDEMTVGASVPAGENQDVFEQAAASVEEETLTEAESDKEKIIVTAAIDQTEVKKLADIHEQTVAEGDQVPEATEKELSEMMAVRPEQVEELPEMRAIRPEQVEEEFKEVAAEMIEPDNENSMGKDAHPLTDTGINLTEEGLSPVQDALLRVHLRILEADPTRPEEGDALIRGQGIVTRLLVPISQVGCLLGKQGKIVARMRGESGAQIRVLPKDQIPACASPDDEIVQITGDLAAVRKALLAVSTQLRNNPPKRPGEDAKLLPPFAEDYPKKGSVMHGKRLPGRSPPIHSSVQSLGIALPFGVEEVMYRLMCPKEKIGSIIGKGGSIIQSIREETGAKISIDVSSDAGQERVIRVSALESHEDPFSKAQRAVMILHNRILAAGQDKDGLVIAKLLVPADQAGCLLGKGGSIVIEMRRLTRAKIHIYGKEHLPPCALKTDELVEVAGNFNASQEALSQITTRLRNNLFHGMAGPGFKESKLTPFSRLASPSERPVSFRQQMTPAAPPYERYQATYEDDFQTGPYSHGSWPSEPAQTYTRNAQSKGVPDYVGLGHTMESSGEPKRVVDAIPKSAFITSQTVQVIVPEHTISSIVGESGSNLQQICKISGARVKVNGVPPGGALERVVEISGTPDQTHAAQSLLQAFILSGQ